MSAVTRKSAYAFLPVLDRQSRGGTVQRVQDVVRDAIVRLEFPPGMAIDKAALCARLGVSRFPVSEALGRLAAEGFVDILPQRGTRVARIDMGDCRQAMFIRRALETEAIALFFPHGIGHMVGLGVRDVGGRAPGRAEGRICCGAKVRVDLPIHANFLMTVEPGLYFVPALLDDPERREKFKNAVAWDALDRWRKVGGIRIEDNILITSSEPTLLTASIPK